jgi:hypothetical protein
MHGKAVGPFIFFSYFRKGVQESAGVLRGKARFLSKAQK